MYDYDARRAEVLDLFPGIDPIARDQGSEEALTRLEAARHRLSAGRLTTVVCGEFKRGKSSLLNALLEDPGLLPTDVDIATSLVCAVEYGETEHVRVVCPGADDGDDGAGDRVLEIDRAEIALYVTESGNPGNARGAQALLIETPNPRLASGLRLVDTPGVGGLNREHTAATYAHLPLADAVVFVADATQPLTEREVEFLRAVTEHVSLMIVAVTKIDLRSDYEVMVANTTAKVAEATGTAPGTIAVIPVSSQAKLDHLRTGDPEDLELSNFPAFEQALWSALERDRGQLLLGAPLADLDRTIAALLLPVSTELDALREESETARARTREELQAKQQRMREVQDGRAAWRRDINDQLTDVNRRLRYSLETGLDRITQRLETDYLNDSAMLADPPQVIGALNRDFGLLLGGVGRTAAEEAATVQAEIERRTGLALDVPQLAGLRAPEVTVPVEDPATLPKTSTVRKTFLGGFRRFRGTLLGAFAGGSVGTLVPLPLLGTLFGAVVGAVGGYMSDAEQVRKAEHSSRRKQLAALASRLLRAQRREAFHVLDDAQTTFRRGIESEFLTKVQLEQASLTKALEALAAAERATAPPARLRHLEQQSRVLESTRARVAAIAQGLGEADGGSAESPASAGRPVVLDTGAFADE